jgi:tRNA(adenine34) deaminase
VQSLWGKHLHQISVDIPPVARHCEGMAPFRSFMEIALEEARAAALRGEVPVGAVIIGPDGGVAARAGNRTRELNDPTAHAEILAIRAACAQAGSDRLPGHDLYVTLEPCPMCAAAISAARVARLYYGASDPKSGGVERGARVFSHPQCHHTPEIYDGIGADASADLLRGFFAARRGPL